MSRSGGAEAHSQVGDGHVDVYGIGGDWRRAHAVEKERMARAGRARGSRASNIGRRVGRVLGVWQLSVGTGTWL